MEAVTECDITKKISGNIFRTQINSKRIMVTCENKSTIYSMLFGKVTNFINSDEDNCENASIITEQYFISSLINFLNDKEDSTYFTYEHALNTYTNSKLQIYAGAPEKTKIPCIGIFMHIKNSPVKDYFNKYYIVCENNIIDNDSTILASQIEYIQIANTHRVNYVNQEIDNLKQIVSEQSKKLETINDLKQIIFEQAKQIAEIKEQLKTKI